MSFFEESTGPSHAPAATNGDGEPYANFDSPAPKRRPAWRAIFGYTFTGLFLVGLAYAINAPTPYVIEQPGSVYNVLGSDEGTKIITIKGAQTYSDEGKLYLLTVGLLGRPGNTPNWFEVLQAWNDPKKKVLPIDAVFPPNIEADKTTKADFEMMADSQQQATAAALRELGYKIPNQVKVVEVEKGTPAEGILKTGDLIVAVNGKQLDNGDTLRAIVHSHTTAEPLKVTVLRAGAQTTLDVKTKKIGSTWRMGISIVDTYVFPIDVKLQLQNVGGPSGGMMFALGIIDKLTPGSITGGQTVAGTGEINGNGEVGPIGGIQQKMFAAVDNGATWFLAPSQNCDEVVGHIPDGLHVTKVSNLDDALKALEAIKANPNTKALPQCSLTK